MVLVTEGKDNLKGIAPNNIRKRYHSVLMLSFLAGATDAKFKFCT